MPLSGPFISFCMKGSLAWRGGLPESTSMRAAFSMTRGGTHSSARPIFFARGAVDVLAGQHHVHRRGRADDLRQAQHAAPAGDDAEHDLGQRELGAGLIHRDAVAAGQRQLGAAAHAMAAHQRQRRVLHGGQPVVGIPAALDDDAGLLRRIGRGEFLDVGAGDEAGVLGRLEDQPLGRILLAFVEDQAQLGHHLGAEGIGRGVRGVEDGPGQCRIGFAFEFPVLVCHHSFSTSTAPP
jgi:hypothetical protein